MLIGLSGKAGVGKDTAYGFIAEWAQSQGELVRRDAFADSLKLSAARALGFEGPLEEAVEFCNKLKGDGWYVAAGIAESGIIRPHQWVTGRAYLQLYGTEAHREIFGTDFWIRAVLDRYVQGEVTVICDCRFPNEAVAIRDLDGQVWQICRPGSVLVEDSHASEQPLPSELIDRTIVNDGSLNQFRHAILSVLETKVPA